MAGFLKGGPRPPMRGGSSPKPAHAFSSGPSSRMPPPVMRDASQDGEDDGTQTKIIHLPSGEYEVHHADGDVTKHPNAEHMTEHLGAKLCGGMDDDMGGMEPDGDESYA